MKKNIISSCFAFVLSILLINLSFAGGPLIVKGGKPVVYKQTMKYRFDQGSLGVLSNSEAIAIIEDLIDDWENLSTSNFTLEKDTPSSIGFDVDDTNYQSILESNDFLGYTAIIFDEDGNLTDAFFGQGAGNSVLGFAGPLTASNSDEIPESQGVFNGRFIDGIETNSNPESSIDTFKGTVIHEFGHAIGLDHSQINIEGIKSGSNQEVADAVPLMFPVAVNDLFIIRRDDESALALLYPNTSALSSFGTIEGKVFRSDGSTPVQGANVIARRIDDSLLEAVSCVSDYLEKNTGEYKLFGLTPGDYRIEIEPIDDSFTGGSSVGPFSTTSTGKSFQNPVPAGYFTGAGLPISLNENEALIVSVSAGQSLTSQNIIGSTQATTSTSSSSSSGSSDGTESEPNDSVNQAQEVSLPVTISGAAAFGDEGDLVLSSDSDETLKISDLYKFTITSNGNLNALLNIESASNDDDLDLVLFDEDASQILDSSSQTGNADELISTNLSAGTYLLGVGAFKGSSDYTLEITGTNDGTGTPSLTITGPDTLVLSRSVSNKVTLLASALNFSNRSKCTVNATSSVPLSIKPPILKLSSKAPSKKIKVKVSPGVANDLIDNNQTGSVTVQVSCPNGASDSFDINILPSADSVNRKYKNIRK